MPFDSAASAESALAWGPLSLLVGSGVWMRVNGAVFESEVVAGGVAAAAGPVSVNAWVVGCLGRPTNAWVTVWLRLPGAEWRLASELRAAAGGAAPARWSVRPDCRPARAPAAAPRSAGVLSLVPFLVRAGGVRDPGGELLAVLGGHRVRPGLISGRGLSVDDAIQAALEAGYFPEFPFRSGREAESLAGALRSAGADCRALDPAAFYDAIDSELRGSPRWPGGVAPESVAAAAAELAAERDAVDMASADSADAAAWRRLVALARDAGAGAVLSHLASLGVVCEPGAAEPDLDSWLSGAPLAEAAPF